MRIVERPSSFARGAAGLLFVLGLAACGTSVVGDSNHDADAGADAGSGNDAGNDAGPGVDAGSDGGTDAGSDGGTDAGSDGGTDAGSDAGVDAGSDAGTDGGSALDGGSEADAGPISATPGAWTWVGFDDAVCSDGSSTGIGVNLSPSGSSDLLVYFEGGGACWSYVTCYTLMTAVNGPYGESQLNSDVSQLSGSLLDRSDAGSPVADWNYVFVPYCTGDVHAGDNVITYSSGNASGTYHHKGRANLEAYLARLTQTFPAPGKLVVSGSSAGGFGALINFDLLAKSWPEASAYLIDDSGPALEQGIPSSTLSAWFSSWNLGAVTDPLCGTACRTDLSLVYPALSSSYPHARMSLLSSEQDSVIRTYFDLTATQFQTDLNQLATNRLDTTSNIREFFVSGDTHTMLGDPASFTSNGVSLTTFLSAQIDDSLIWVAEKP